MKKGFTLVEMLAVIVILAIISLIVFPEVNKTINNSKQRSYKTQIDNLIKATKQLVVKDTNILPEPQNNAKRCVTITELFEAGEIESDNIEDSRRKNTKINGVIIITYNSTYNSYVYEYNETCQN